MVDGEVELVVETTADRAWCGDCGVRAVRKDRSRMLVRDVDGFGRRTQFVTGLVDLHPLPAAGRGTKPCIPHRRHPRGRPARPHHPPMTEILNCYRSDGLSNARTEAVNGLMKKIKRIGHGFRNLGNYRLRLPLHCGGVTRQDQPAPKLRRRTPRIVA